MIQIPDTIIPVTASEQAKLQARLWQAKAWIYDNPMAKATHYRTLANLKKAAKVVRI